MIMPSYFGQVFALPDRIFYILQFSSTQYLYISIMYTCTYANEQLNLEIIHGQKLIDAQRTKTC